MGYNDMDRHDKIEHDFSYHQPPGEVGEVMDQVRGVVMNAMHDLVNLVPPGRDYSMGYTHMEEAQRCFIAALAKPELPR